MRRTASATASATASSHVISQARPSGPCSAWRTTSMAACSGGTVASAITTTSDGPGEGRRHADQALARHLALGLGDPGAAGADDDVDGPDRLGAVRQRGDGRRPADPVHLVGAGQVGGGQDADGHPAVGPGAATTTTSGTPATLAGTTVIERGRHQRRLGHRHVAAGPVDRPHELAHLDGAVVVDDLGRELGGVVGGDVVAGGLEGGPQVGRYGVDRGRHLRQAGPAARRSPRRRSAR